MADEPPEAKLQSSALLGGIVCVAAVVTSTLCNEDPWGGASMTSTSLCWAAVGGLASLPLVALRLWSWNRAAYKLLPVLDDMHRQQLQIVTPWFMRMNRLHVAAMMALEVLPMTLLLLPAAQGVLIAWSGSLLQLLNPFLSNDGAGMGMGDGTQQAGEMAVRAAGLVLTAAFTATGRGMELSMSEEEYEVIETATDNADRYYRLMAMDVHSRGTDADRAALAFKCVAQVYLDMRSDAALLAGAITFMDIMYFGGLWYLTGNLAAPAVAALAANWVDYFHYHQVVEEQGAKGKDSGRSPT